MRLIRYFFLFILLCGNGCYADDSGYNLEFTGTIVAQTCDVEISSLSQSIDLGQFSVADFPSTGTTTKFKPFNINLKNCSRGITGSKIWFTGTADSDNPALLALSDTGMGSEKCWQAALAWRSLMRTRMPSASITPVRWSTR